ARVALTAGTTAQLVVDPPRLVPLGAQDVEAADPLDLLLLRLDRLLGPLQRLGEGLRPLLDVLLRVEAALTQLRLGEVLGVAAQLDVRTAAGHVRGDRDTALAAGLGDDRRLPLLVLGVEHLVLDAALAELLG